MKLIPALTNKRSAASYTFLITLFSSCHGLAHSSPSAWQFSSGDHFCQIKTSVQSDQSKLYVLASVSLKLYYIEQSVITNPCYEGLTQNTISASVFTDSAARIQEGTHALFQSKRLWNEQAPIHKFNNDCRLKPVYTLDYRTTDLLLNALHDAEEILLNAHLTKFGPLTGRVRTQGFEEAYEELVDCIDGLSGQSLESKRGTK